MSHTARKPRTPTPTPATRTNQARVLAYLQAARKRGERPSYRVTAAALGISLTRTHKAFQAIRAAGLTPDWTGCRAIRWVAGMDDAPAEPRPGPVVGWLPSTDEIRVATEACKATSLAKYRATGCGPGPGESRLAMRERYVGVIMTRRTHERGHDS